MCRKSSTGFDIYKNLGTAYKNFCISRFLLYVCSPLKPRLILAPFNPHTLYNELSAAARAVGCSLSDICTEADIPRNTVQNWKDSPPRSFLILEKLLKAIEAKAPVTPPVI